MYRSLFFIIIFCLLFTTSLSIQCYTGTDRECIVALDTTDCGPNSTCHCGKYRYQCAANDTICNQYEQTNKIKIWTYAVVSNEICQAFKEGLFFYEEGMCCSTDRCIRPNSTDYLWAYASRAPKD